MPLQGSDTTRTGGVKPQRRQKLRPGMASRMLRGTWISFFVDELPLVMDLRKTACPCQALFAKRWRVGIHSNLRAGHRSNAVLRTLPPGSFLQIVFWTLRRSGSSSSTSLRWVHSCPFRGLLLTGGGLCCLDDVTRSCRLRSRPAHSRCLHGVAGRLSSFLPSCGP